jgi:hypothetical protein
VKTKRAHHFVNTSGIEKEAMMLLRERERERETDRQTERQTERQTDRERERERERETETESRDRERERGRERERERETERDTDRERETKTERHESRASHRREGSPLEAEVQVAPDIDPKLFPPNRFGFANLVHGLGEGGVTDTERRPHGQVSVHKVSFEGIAGAGDDGEGGVGE